MNDKIYAEYGQAGHKFPRTTKEAFGRDECIFVATDYDEDKEIADLRKFSTLFAFSVYGFAAIVVGVILWGLK